MASLRRSIDAKCKSCIYDPDARGLGAWREQVAYCYSSNCALHPVRPVPRDCMVAGSICPSKIADLRAKIDARDAAQRT